MYKGGGGDGGEGEGIRGRESLSGGRWLKGGAWSMEWRGVRSDEGRRL